MRLAHRLLGLFVLGLLCARCGSATDEPSPESSADATGGGAGTATGGHNAGGTTHASGGTTHASGGATGAGGTTYGSGGAAGTGGAVGTGGATGTGGVGACGGTAVIASDAGSPQTPGTWKDVTPVPTLSSAGAQTILVDPVRPSDIYVNIDVQGTWRSTDYGLTWSKANKTTEVSGGRQWYAAIDMNPCRDPNTAPALYTTLGWGTSGIWKSTDWGVDWTNVWNGNVFREDGVTNVSSDVGSDIHSIEIVDPADPNHLIASLHGYWGTGNNNGVFETTDGGKTWIDHNKVTFNFVAHADLLFAAGPTTWLVSHGTTWPHSELYRTTDAGQTWTKVADDVSIGRSTVRAGSNLYANAGGSQGLWKSTDDGKTWATVPNAVRRNYSGSLFKSATKIYFVDANDGNDHGAEIRWAPIDNDAVWTSIPLAPGIWNLYPNDGNWTAGTGSQGWGVATFDGTHSIIVTSNFNGGVWRYVEP